MFHTERDGLPVLKSPGRRAWSECQGFRVPVAEQDINLPAFGVSSRCLGRCAHR